MLGNLHHLNTASTQGGSELLLNFEAQLVDQWKLCLIKLQQNHSHKGKSSSSFSGFKKKFNFCSDDGTK